MKRDVFYHAASLLLALCLLMSTALATMQEEKPFQPKYTRIRSFTAGLTISSTGYAECRSRVTSSYSTDTINLIVELQRSADGNTWETVKSWDASEKGTVYLEKGWYVSSGYSYQVLATAEVYTSFGVWQETDSTNSLVVKY